MMTSLDGVSIQAMTCDETDNAFTSPMNEDITMGLQLAASDASYANGNIYGSSAGSG
jgi:hypothetical protein